MTFSYFMVKFVFQQLAALCKLDYLQGQERDSTREEITRSITFVQTVSKIIFKMEAQGK